jgi:hypothetical protein
MEVEVTEDLPPPTLLCLEVALFSQFLRVPVDRHL